MWAQAEAVSREEKRQAEVLSAAVTVYRPDHQEWAQAAQEVAAADPCVEPAEEALFS